jgi:hypothetical protein
MTTTAQLDKGSIPKIAVCHFTPATAASGLPHLQVTAPDISTAHITDDAGLIFQDVGRTQAWVHALWPNLKQLFIVVGEDFRGGCAKGHVRHTFQDMAIELGLWTLHIQTYQDCRADPCCALIGGELPVDGDSVGFFPDVMEPRFCRGTRDTPCGCFERDFFHIPDVVNTAVLKDRIVVVEMPTVMSDDAKVSRTCTLAPTDPIVFSLTVTSSNPEEDSFMLSFTDASDAFASFNVIPIHALLLPACYLRS